MRLLGCLRKKEKKGGRRKKRRRILKSVVWCAFSCGHEKDVAEVPLPLLLLSFLLHFLFLDFRPNFFSLACTAYIRKTKHLIMISRVARRITKRKKRRRKRWKTKILVQETEQVCQEFFFFAFFVSQLLKWSPQSFRSSNCILFLKGGIE